MNSWIINELTPLSDKDCFYIIERYKTEFTYPLHQHAEYELNFIERGAGATRIVGDSIETIGDYELVLLTGEQVAHVWEQGRCRSTSIREITIQFRPDVFPESMLARNQFASIRKMFEQARNGLAFSLHTIMKVYATLDGLSSEESGFRQVIRIMELLYELSVSKDSRVLASNSFVQVKASADSRRIAKVEEYVKTHYTEEVRLSTLADLVGMTPVAFSRFFKVRAGRNLSDYIIDIRLGIATRQLVDSTKAVAEIAYECGFNNLSNFNRIFKKKKGFTPKEFREYYRKHKILC